MGIKDKIKAYLEKQRKKAKEQRAYNEKVKKAVKKAKREAFQEEAVKQAKIRAKIEAQRKFNPTPQQQQAGLNIPRSLLDPVGFSSPQPQAQVQRVVKKIKKKRSKKKKKRYGYVPVQPQIPARDPAMDIVWNT